MWLACVCVFVICLCSGVCLCVSGCEPSILLTPSGLCVGLFHQHYHLLVFYSGPQGYNDCTTFQICSSSPSDRLPYLESGSHFLSELDSLVPFSWVKMVCTWTGVSWAEFDYWLMSNNILVSVLHCWITLKCGFSGKGMFKDWIYGVTLLPCAPHVRTTTKSPASSVWVTICGQWQF